MYFEKDLVRIAKRENNTKRSYLVVNRLQGKHIPVKPSEAFAMFGELAETLKSAYEGERLLLVGFAETATAIGAAVAVELGTKYIQTTREVIEGAEYIFFSEEHSHATEQKLVKNDIDSVIEELDRIVFVEDEVTTGKTILNIIQMLEKLYPAKVQYAVASLLNGMDEAALQLYAGKGIPLHYLVKTNHEGYGALAEQFTEEGEYVACDVAARESVRELCIGAARNARRLVDAKEYKEACEALWGQVAGLLEKELAGRVLVLGTEEFMYPAMYIAGRIEQMGVQAVSHATTRSPIAVSAQTDYPLHVRYELRSLYDRERVTFVYDIEAYDAVLIVTDAQGKEPEGLNSLVNAVHRKNEKIFCIRWC